MFFNHSTGGVITASILLCSVLTGCASAPTVQPDKSRVSLGVQLVRTPAEVTRSVPSLAPKPWRPPIGDTDDVDIDEQDELAEILAKTTGPVTRPVSRDREAEGKPVFSEGDVDAESGLD